METFSNTNLEVEGGRLDSSDNFILSTFLFYWSLRNPGCQVPIFSYKFENSYICIFLYVTFLLLYDAMLARFVTNNKVLFRPFDKNPAKLKRNDECFGGKNRVGRK